jgi:hypothetical protein
MTALQRLIIKRGYCCMCPLYSFSIKTSGKSAMKVWLYICSKILSRLWKHVSRIQSLIYRGKEETLALTREMMVVREGIVHRRISRR